MPGAADARGPGASPQKLPARKGHFPGTSETGLATAAEAPPFGDQRGGPGGWVRRGPGRQAVLTSAVWVAAAERLVVLPPLAAKRCRFGPAAPDLILKGEAVDLAAPRHLRTEHLPPDGAPG